MISDEELNNLTSRIMAVVLQNAERKTEVHEYIKYILTAMLIRDSDSVDIVELWTVILQIEGYLNIPRNLPCDEEET